MSAELEFAFSPEALVGWRVWRVARPVDHERSALALAGRLRDADPADLSGFVDELFRARLRSLTELTFWPAGRRFEAVCGAEHARRPGDHGPAPEVGCECGIWAFRDAASAERAVAAYAFCGGAIAFGRVALWGRVIEHERGWRAQYAAPVELALCGASPDVADELASAYRVDVVLAAWPEAIPAPLDDRPAPGQAA